MSQISDIISILTSDTGKDPIITPEQNEKIIRLIQYCNMHYNNQAFYGNDALNRLILLDPIVADNLCSDPDLIAIILNQGDKISIIRNTKSGEALNFAFRDVLIFGFKQSLEVIKHHPNNEEVYGLAGYQEQQAKFEKNTLRIVGVIELLAKEKLLHLTQNGEDKPTALQVLFLQVCEYLDFLSISHHTKIRLLEVAGYTAVEILGQCKSGFRRLVNLTYEENRNDTQKPSMQEETLTQFCERVLANERIFLDGKISHLFYDRLHLTAALISEEKYSFSDSSSISLREFFSRLIEIIAANPGKYNIAENQLRMRLNLISKKLHENFDVALHALKKLKQQKSPVGIHEQELLDSKGKYLPMEGPLPKSIYTRILEEIAKTIENKENEIHYRLIDQQIYLIVKNRDQSEKIYNVSETLKYANLQHIDAPSAELTSRSEAENQDSEAWINEPHIQKLISHTEDFRLDIKTLIETNQILLPKEKSAIRRYTGKGFVSVNAFLRGGDNLKYFTEEGLEINSKIISNVIETIFTLATALKKIKSGLSLVQELKANNSYSNAYRSKRFIIAYPKMPDYGSLSKQRSVVSEEGFLSTTVSSTFNEKEFIKDQLTFIPHEAKGPKVIYAFHFPATSSGAFIAPWANIEYQVRELEKLLFPSQFCVTDYSLDEEGNVNVSFEDILDISTVPQESQNTHETLEFFDSNVILPLFKLYDEISKRKDSDIIKSCLEEILYFFQKINHKDIKEISFKIIALFESYLKHEIRIDYLYHNLVEILGPILSVDAIDIIYRRYRQSPAILRLLSEPMFSFLKKAHYLSEDASNFRWISELDQFKLTFANSIHDYEHTIFDNFTRTEKNKFIDDFLDNLTQNSCFNIACKDEYVVSSNRIFTNYIAYHQFKKRVATALTEEFSRIFIQSNENDELQKKIIQDIFLSACNSFTILEDYLPNNDLLDNIPQKISIMRDLLKTKIDCDTRVTCNFYDLQYKPKANPIHKEYDDAFNRMLRGVASNKSIEPTNSTTLNEEYLKKIRIILEQFSHFTLKERISILVLTENYDVLSYLLSSIKIVIKLFKDPNYNLNETLTNHRALDKPLTNIQRECILLTIYKFIEAMERYSEEISTNARFAETPVSASNLCYRAIYIFKTLRNFNINYTDNISELTRIVEEKSFSIENQFKLFKLKLTDALDTYHHPSLNHLTKTEKDSLINIFIDILIKADVFDITRSDSYINRANKLFDNFVTHRQFRDKVTTTLNSELEKTFIHPTENSETQKNTIREIFLSSINKYAPLEDYLQNNNLLDNITHKIIAMRDLLETRIDCDKRLTLPSNIYINNIFCTFHYEKTLQQYHNAFNDILRNVASNKSIESMDVTTLNEQYLKDISDKFEKSDFINIRNRLTILISSGNYHLLSYLLSNENIAKKALFFSSPEEEEYLKLNQDRLIELNNLSDDKPRECFLFVLDKYVTLHLSNNDQPKSSNFFHAQPESISDLCHKVLENFNIYESFGFIKLVDIIEKKRNGIDNVNRPQ